MKVKKTISFFLVLIIFMTQCVFLTNAAGTIYENESLAVNTTYDDYNNYGYISAAYESDFWQITFSQTGMVTFYLGSIPSGIDYDMYLYKGSSNSPIAYSISTSNQSEYIRCKVTPGIAYKIEIVSTDSKYSTTDSYLFRAKRYDLRDVKVFTTDIDINTRSDATKILAHTASMGYQGGEYLNNSANAAYVTFPNTDIIVTSNHGTYGKLTFNNSYLFAQNSSLSGGDRALSNYAAGALSNVDLIIYSNCKSSATSNVNGNVRSETLNKGAFLCIGWNDTIYVGPSNIWLNKFFDSCSDGKNVREAMIDADSAVLNSNMSEYYNSMINRLPDPYSIASSRMDSLVIN